MSENTVLPAGIFPVQVKEDALDAPFWEGTRDEEIRIQRCRDCEKFQWGPELICHHCHSFDLDFVPIAPTGTIYSWERVWHPPTPKLAESVPFVILVVELDEAPGIRLIGNRVGEPGEAIEIGTRVQAHFEHQDAYTLVQWKTRETL